jgi:hypothetical protein
MKKKEKEWLGWLSEMDAVMSGSQSRSGMGVLTVLSVRTSKEEGSS